MKKMEYCLKGLGAALLMTAITTTGVVSEAIPVQAESAVSLKNGYVNQNSKAFDVLDLVNQERKKAGLNELTMDEELMQCAQIRGKEITTVFSHMRPDGSSCFSVSKKAMGENIALGYSAASKVMSGWMASPGHRENILRPGYKSVGIACVTYKGRNYWVQIFGYAKADHEVKREEIADANQAGNVTTQEVSQDKQVVSAKATTTVSKEKKATIKAAKAKNQKVKIKINNYSKAKKYCLEYSEKSNFKSKKVKFIKKSTCTVTKLKKGKTYYFRVRTYTVNTKGKKVYHSNSKVQKIKL